MIALLALLGGVAAVPLAVAAPTPATDDGPNFNESAGCGHGEAGPTRPRSDVAGYLSPSQVIYGPYADFFGRTKAQVDASMVNWLVPGGGGKTAKVHERALPAFEMAAEAIGAASSGYSVRYAFGYAWRTVSGSNAASMHAFGNAIDINPPTNPYTSADNLITDMPDWFVDAWTSAGFCWGGDWQSVKDAMHFSWMGPAATPGYPGRPAPYPPITASSPWTQKALAGSIPYGAGGVFDMGDASGDGAPDLYAVTNRDGFIRVEVAGARQNFGMSGLRVDTDVPWSDSIVLADADRDGHADLWAVDLTGPTIALHVRSSASDFEVPLALSTTAIPITDAMEVTAAHYDDDYDIDLVVFRRTTPASVEVWSGSSGFTSKIVDSVLPATVDTDDLLALVDHDVDGIPEVLVVQRGTSAVATVVYASGQTQVHETTMAIGSNDALAVSDYDGDGRQDLAVVSSGELTIHLGGVRGATEDLSRWFMPETVSLWDAGPECVGECDRLAYVDDEARWSIKDAISSNADVAEVMFGNPGDVPLAGDWDCDGIDTPGLYRSGDGFVYLRNSNTTGTADSEFFFGNPGDVPLAGDFDGDGCDSVSLYRPADGRFYIMNEIGSALNGIGEADHSFAFGNPGDKPFIGDFDGDGDDEIALHRESTGFMYLRFDLAGGAAEREFYFGDPGDVPVAGDWDGDGVDTVAVYRPSNGNWYLKLDLGAGPADHSFHFHSDDRNHTVPVVGAFDTVAEE